jgi:hypothetical protein
MSRAARSRPAPLPIFPILLHVVFLRFPSLAIPHRSAVPRWRQGSRLLGGSQFNVAVARAISGVRRRAGECPAPLQIGERGNRFLRPHAINARCRIAMRPANFAQIYTDVPTPCPDARRRAQNRRSSAYAPKKHSAPGCWSLRMAAPAAERCSNAVLECPVYRRFAVTSQLQNVADFIPAMCSSGGSSALVVQSIDRNGYAPVSNFEGQASGPTA